MSYSIIDWEQFVERYKPRPNPDPEQQDYWYGCLLDATGTDYELVREAPANTIWTVVETEDGDDQVVIPGHHIANRIGYILTDVPFNNEALEVRDL